MKYRLHFETGNSFAWFVDRWNKIVPSTMQHKFDHTGKYYIIEVYNLRDVFCLGHFESAYVINKPDEHVMIPDNIIHFHDGE